MLGATPTWTDVVVAVTSVITAAGIVVAGIAARVAWRQVKQMNMDRQALILLDHSRRWDESLLTEAREAASNYRTPKELRTHLQQTSERNEREFYVLMRLPHFFEDLAVMVKHKALDFDIVDDAWGMIIPKRW